MARRSGRRTDYQWFNVGDFENGIDIGAVAAFGSTGLAILAPGTITRIRGKIGATLDAGAVDEAVMLLAGLVVLNSDGFAAGAAPELLTTGADEASWIWQGALYLSSGSEAAVVDDSLSAQIEIDTKAMRRVKPGLTLAMVFEVPAALARDQTGTVDVSWYIHCLDGS